MNTSFVVGLGPGPLGFRELAAVLNQQADIKVSVERMPLLPWEAGSVSQPQLQRRLARMQGSNGILAGDIATYYLPYAERLAKSEPHIKFVAVVREKQQVVEDYERWLDRQTALPLNHWSTDTTLHCPQWSRCFPHYPNVSRAEGVRRFWDEYMTGLTQLEKLAGDRLHTLEAAAISQLGPVNRLLDFLEVNAASRFVESLQPLEELSATVRPVANPLDPAHCVVIVPYLGSIYRECEDALNVLASKGYTVWRVGGYSAIDQGRNQLATNAMIQGFAETLWIDADIGFDPADVGRLRAHPLPIVAGMYPKKGLQELAGHVVPGTAAVKFGIHGGLVPMNYLPTGFLLVRREVYLTMQAKLGLPVCNELFNSPHIPYFQPFVRSHEESQWYLGEDFSFCERAKACGYNLWMDTRIRLWHIGNYRYSWEDAGIAPQRYDDFTLNLKVDG